MKKLLIFGFLACLFLASCHKKTCPTYMTQQEVGLMELQLRGGDGKKPKKIKKDNYGRIKKRKWMQ